MGLWPFAGHRNHCKWYHGCGPGAFAPSSGYSQSEVFVRLFCFTWNIKMSFIFNSKVTSFFSIQQRMTFVFNKAVCDYGYFHVIIGLYWNYYFRLVIYFDSPDDVRSVSKVCSACSMIWSILLWPDYTTMIIQLGILFTLPKTYHLKIGWASKGNGRLQTMHF